jgi:hypothetical protein
MILKLGMTLKKNNASRDRNQSIVLKRWNKNCQINVMNGPKIARHAQ